MVEVARRGRVRRPLDPLRDGARRALDIVLCLIAMVIAGPLMLVLIGLIRLSSPGPGLFRQERVGRGRQPFTMLKLRTMFTGNNDQIHRTYVTSLLKDEQPAADSKTGLYKLNDDPRVTRLGSILRRTSLDELPQLLNVLSGSMSLVGPRPVLAWEADMFDPVHLRRFEVKPGITGLWQIRGRSKLGMREALDLDVEYVLRRSIARDLFILVMTVPALFRGGAS
jgi:lipopolysaccharide/colanic/teichoic acid biosynthesis glycosyltransferase